MNTNKVAQIFKGYAIINAIVVLLASMIIANNTGEILFFIIGVALDLFINFLLYACGELIQLLQDIKDNTSRGMNAGIVPPKDEEIPEI